MKKENIPLTNTQEYEVWKIWSCGNGSYSEKNTERTYYHRMKQIYDYCIQKDCSVKRAIEFLIERLESGYVIINYGKVVEYFDEAPSAFQLRISLCRHKKTEDIPKECAPLFLEIEKTVKVTHAWKRGEMGKILRSSETDSNGKGKYLALCDEIGRSNILTKDIEMLKTFDENDYIIEDYNNNELESSNHKILKLALGKKKKDIGAIFRQLYKECYFDNSAEDIATFLKSNFDCFNNTTIKSITSNYLTENTNDNNRKSEFAEKIVNIAKNT